MALAWNAGWVNSPQGFKSPILRTRTGVRLGHHSLVAPRATNTQGGACGAGSRSCGTRRSCHCRCPVLPVRPAALVGADGRHGAHPGHRHAHRHRCPDRPGRAAGGVHPVAHPQAGVPHAPACPEAAHWSIALHVLAGVLIIGAAISEIWLSLDDAGQWLFGIYGAAAAIALLGIFAFYLADIAELPPPPPKPLKPKTEKQRRGRGSKAEADNDNDETAEDEASSKTTADETATKAARPTPMTRLRTNRPRSRPNPRSPKPTSGRSGGAGRVRRRRGPHRVDQRQTAR